MGETHNVWMPVYIGERPDDLIRRTIRVLIDNGFETTSDSDTNLVEWYRFEGDDRDDIRRDATLDEVIKEFRTTDDVDTVVIRIWTSENPSCLRVEFNDEESVTYPTLALFGPDEWELGDKGNVEYDVARERSDRLADALVGLAEEFDPWFAFARVHHPYDGGDAFPEGKPPNSGVETIPWMTVFGEEWFDRFGGRGRVLDAPSWRVESLDSGGVFLRSHDVPARIRSDATGGSDISTYDYLFRRESIDDLQSEIERQKSTFVDPYRDLDDGELASDVVMCEAHAPFEFEEMDYASIFDEYTIDDMCHVFCVYRDGDKLWEANNDEFIRRLVDDGGQPIGELPDGVPPHQEMISHKVVTEHHGVAPLDMLRMDAPDEPSLTAKLFGLSRAREGESIWQDEDEPVTGT